jgi:hypothetical protein
MKILICGGNGFIGTKLTEEFRTRNWKVENLSRADLLLNHEALAIRISGCDVLINLAGAPIIKRWTKHHKQEIWDSRILTTRRLAAAVNKSTVPPQLFISTSAVGIYADTFLQTENNAVFAKNYLAELCVAWEKEALAATSAGRIAIFRISVVLGKNGGALKKMMMPFRFGFGGRISSGKQGFSWCHIHDVVAAFTILIENTERGIFNLAAPEPTDNRGFTKALAHAMHRPALIPLPAWVLKLLYGGGSIALTEGQKVLPEHLTECGFKFKYPKLEEALRDIIHE